MIKKLWSISELKLFLCKKLDNFTINNYTVFFSIDIYDISGYFHSGIRRALLMLWQIDFRYQRMFACNAIGQRDECSLACSGIWVCEWSHPWSITHRTSAPICTHRYGINKNWHVICTQQCHTALHALRPFHPPQPPRCEHRAQPGWSNS